MMDDFEKDFSDGITKAAYDQTMLKTLLVEFLRESYIPFVVVNNSRFKAIFRFISPKVVLPSDEDLIKHNAIHNNLFNSWEQWKNADFLDSDRCKMVKKWTEEDLRNGSFQNPTRNERPHLSEFRDSSIETELENKRTIVGFDALATEVMDQHFPSHIPGPSNTENKISPSINQNLDIKPHPDNIKIVRDQSPPAKRMRTNLSKTSDEGSGARAITESSRSSRIPKASNTSDQKPSPVTPTQENLHPLQQPSQIPPPDQSSAQNVCKDVQINGTWPCIVCAQPREFNKIRSLPTLNGFFMIHLCTITEQYSMDQAKQMARMKKFRCCVDHLVDMYEHAKNYLNVLGPMSLNTVIHPRNPKVIEAFHAVSQLRSGQFNEEAASMEVNWNHLNPFIISLKKFFTDFVRQKN